MKKRISTLFVLAAVLALASALFIACGGKEKHTHTAQFTEAQNATCTANGNIAFWYCDGCQKYFRDEQCTDEIEGDVVVLATNHQRVSLIKHAAKDPTCNTDGNILYYECADCHAYFDDAKAVWDITNKASVTLRATHHSRVALIEHAPQDPTCEADGNSLYYECADCHLFFEDNKAARKIENKESVKIAATRHLRVALIKHAAKAPTCETDGNSLYYECRDCHAYFSDDLAEHKIANKASVKIAATHHLRDLQRHERQEATCTENGNALYWQCGDCQKYFDSENATHEIQWSSIEIPAAHKFLAYENSDTEHWHKCEVCGTEERSEHAFSESGACICDYKITVGLSYRMIDGETCAVSGIGTATETTDVVIPAKIDGRTVVGIDDFAFSEDSENIVSITIPSSIESIGQYVFQGCSKLTTLNWNATACTTAESATVPMLDGCRSVRTIVVGDNVKSLPKGVFAGCSALQTITLPFVGNGTGEKTHFGWIFGADTYSENNKVPASLRTVRVTGGKSIGANAFANCTSLTKIDLPDTVTAIGANAFRDCSTLMNIRLPDTLETVGEDAFFDCPDLAYTGFRNAQYLGNSENPYVVLVRASASSITICTIHENTRVIYGGAFKNCGSLSTSDLPARVASIGNSAFENCAGLTSVTVATDGALTAIGDAAFRGCGLLSEIDLPARVVSIGKRAFYNCSGLTAVHIEDIAAWCNIEFGDYSANPLNCAGHLYKDGTEIKNLEIPQDVSEIKKYAFYGCEGLISVTIPGSVSSIGEEAFYYCTGLERVTIPDPVTNIGTDAFKGCSNIMTATMPTTAISYIPKSSLQTVVLTSGESIAASAFSGCSTLQTITIPDSVTNIGNNAFVYCSNIITATMPTTAISYIPKNSLQTVVLTSGESIPANAFKSCATLQTITIPDSVASIGDSAFRGCSGLASITIPESVTSIGSDVFYDCTGLTNVSIPDSVTSIGDSVFEDCTNLISVSLPDITSIGEYAFGGCERLESITIPESVGSIGNSAFRGCTGLTSVTIPDSVTSIGSGAFGGCTGLTSVAIGSGVGNIGTHAFSECISLNAVHVKNIAA